MLIGELAQRTGVSRRSLRCYDEIGLLPTTRTPGGYRDYESIAPRCVRQIQQLLDVGFNTDAIADILPCLDNDDLRVQPCPDVRERFSRHLDTIETRIAALENTRDRVAHALQSIDTDLAVGP